MKNYLLITIITLLAQLHGQEYIQITRPDINIRMLPSTSSPIIGHAFADEVYILTGEEEKWYSVLLPSGESRWIYKKLAKKIQVDTTLNPDLDLIKIQQELKIASDNANKDANEENIHNLKIIINIRSMKWALKKNF